MSPDYASDEGVDLATIHGEIDTFQDLGTVDGRVQVPDLEKGLLGHGT